MGTQHTAISRIQYHIVRSPEFAVPLSLQRLIGTSGAANSTELRKTTARTLQVQDHFGRAASPVQVLAEPFDTASGQFFICANPYPTPDGSDAWLVANAQGEAVFAARNLALCRLFAAQKKGFLKMATEIAAK